MERGVAVFERRAFDLADPLQHEGHRGDLVAALQQRFDDQLKRLGRIELIDEHPPEFHVAGGGAGFVPGGQRAGHEVRRDFDFLAHEPLDAADAGRGVFVPPARRAARARRRTSASCAASSTAAASVQARAHRSRICSTSSIRSSTRKSWTVFSSAGNRLKLPPKPTMFQGSTSAPHSMPRCEQVFDLGQIAGRRRRADGRRSPDGRR